jgi:membrane fusion protein, multidrug efflux system
MKHITMLMLLTLFMASCNREAKEKGPEESLNEQNIEGENNESADIIERESLSEVEGILLKKGGFSKELSANGKISAIVKVDVRTKLNGPVMQIKVSNGQWVKAGQLIAVHDTLELYHTYKRQKLLFEKARLDFSDALIALGYSSENIVGIPPGQLRNAEMRSGIALAETDFDIARDKYLLAFIKAPVGGRVANLNLNEGNYPNNGFICAIIDNSKLRVDFFILEEESSIVRQGLKVDVSPFYNDRLRMEGTISAVNPTVDNGLIMVSALVDGNNPSLYDGITVKVFVKSAPKQCLAIPKEAIVLRTAKKVVFTYSSGEKVAKWNYVETGEENSTHVEVVKGLHEMDTVIVSGNLHLGNDVPCMLRMKE